jgi:glucose-6-phosphate 1-dehydrogenase
MSDKQPTTIVIFGASGDLTRRKLVPALFRLYRQNRLTADLQIVGFAVPEWDTAEFRHQMRSGADEFAREPFSEAKWAAFAGRLHYTSGGFTEAADFEHLRQFLEALERKTSHRLYYLATPPRFFADIIVQLGAAEMAKDLGSETGTVAHSTGSGQAAWRRVIIEKPFGRDLASAQALNQAVHTVLDEYQIYRIDHYLAKETVQNILVFRFANTMFEPIWNRNTIDHVQITVAEAVDVGHRAGYYDQAGVLRDMFQNHLMQLLALVAMEPPAAFDADAIRDEKVKTEVKIPGQQIAMQPVDMDFHYDDTFAADSVPEAYETLLLNALEGDATLFTRSDGIEAA